MTMQKIFFSKNVLLKPLAGLSAVVLLAASCGNGSDNVNPDAGFVDYVEAYTGGLVSEGSSVKIQFASTPQCRRKGFSVSLHRSGERPVGWAPG